MQCGADKRCPVDVSTSAARFPRTAASQTLKKHGSPPEAAMSTEAFSPLAPGESNADVRVCAIDMHPTTAGHPRSTKPFRLQPTIGKQCFRISFVVCVLLGL